jgi:hypothetical protein
MPIVTGQRCPLKAANIKIQRPGPKMPVESTGLLPAADLERWKGQVNQGIYSKKLLSAQRFMNKTRQPSSLRRNVAYSRSSSSTIE